MAGPFYNPQAGMGIEAAGASAVESPVAPVTTSAADAVTAGLNLATQGVSLYAQDQRYKNRYGRSGGSSSDPNLARFSEEMDKVQQIRETQGENAARMAERQVGTNFAGVGIAFDQDFQRVYQQKTGKPFKLYGKDEEAAYRDTMLQNESVRNNITASYAVLGPQATFEERVNWSLNQDSVVKAAALTVDIAQANATLAWNQKADGKPSPREAYDTVLDNFIAISFGAFERAVNKGQIVTAQDIANSKAQFTQVLSALSRPPGLTGTDGDEQWKVFTDKTDKIKAMYEALENATSNKVLQETMTQYLANAISKSTDITDINQAITTLAIIKGDPLTLQALSGNKFGDLAKALGKVDLNISNDSSSMFAFNLGSTPGLGGPPGSGGPPGAFVIDPKIKASVSGKTPGEVVDNIKGSANYAKIFDPKAMNNRENHEPFRNMASTIAAVLHSDNQENFLSPEFIAANITNPKMMATLKAYAANDPDVGARLMGGYSEGLQLEKLRQTLNLQSIEASDLGKHVKFDESTKTYVLDETGFAKEGGGFTEVMQKDLGAFQATLRDEYNNNLSEAAKDGFKKFYLSSGGRISSDVGNPLNIIAKSGIRSLGSAVKRREAIAALDKGISDLTLNQETGQTKLNQGQTMDQRSEVTLTPTNRMTSAGRRLYETSEGELVSELTVTVQDPNSKLYYNIPSVNNGTMMSVDEAAELYFGKGEVKDVETGRVIQGFETVEEAVDAARARTQNLNQGQTMDQAPPPPTPPAIVQPAGATSSVSDTLMDTLVLIESENDPNALSPAGARGLYQLMPETAAKPGFKVKPLSTGSDIDAAPVEEQRRFSKDYLSAMLKRYDGDLALALAAYNGGAGRVDDYIKDGKALPAETVEYVQKFVNQGQVPQENSVSSGKVVEPSSGPGLVSRVGTAIGQALSSPAQAAPLPDSMLPPGFRSTDSQGRPFIRPEAGAEVTESSMLGSLISSVRSALNLGSDEEAQSVAEKLMQSGIIPRRPEGLSGDEPMRLPPVRGSEQNNLPPSNPRLAAAQLRQQRKDQDSIALNSESLAQLDPSTAESIINLGAPVAGLVLRQLPWANVQAFGQYLSKGKVDIKDVPFNKSDVELIKEKVSEALAKGKNRLDYPDWGVTGKGVLVGGLLGTAQKSVTDPNFRMATFLGQVGIRKAPNGDIILVDKYDFNPGPKGDKLKEALLARETGDAATYEKLKEEALGGLSWLEATRVWAATLKISDEPAEEFTINLGKLD